MRGTQAITVELPEEVLADLGSPAAAAERLRQYAVLDLLRRKRISQGKAAELLQLDRSTLFDLMAQLDVPTADLTVEDLDQELATLRALGEQSG
jgi:predicted HTH domain antitoxin